MGLVGGTCIVFAACMKLLEVSFSQHMASETIHLGCAFPQTINWSRPKGRLPFKFWGINRFSILHTGLSPVKDFIGGPDEGLDMYQASGQQSDAEIIIPPHHHWFLSQHEIGWETAETSSSLLMRTAWDNSRERDPWGWKDSFKYASESVGKVRSWDGCSTTPATVYLSE